MNAKHLDNKNNLYKQSGTKLRLHYPTSVIRNGWYHRFRIFFLIMQKFYYVGLGMFPWLLAAHIPAQSETSPWVGGLLEFLCPGHI